MIVMVAAAAVMLAGCDGKPEPERLPAALRIDPVITRATEVDFEAGDCIGLTVTLPDGTLHADNVILTYDGGSFSGDLKWYSDGGVRSSLKAYYPYSGNGFPYVFTVGADQREGAGKWDLMLATKQDVKPQEEPVTMEFRHQLSQIVLAVEGDSDVTIDEVVFEGLIPTIDFNIDDAGGITATADESAGRIDISAEPVVPGKRFRAIVVPQRSSFGVRVKSRSGGSVVERFTEVTMKPGYTYTVTAKVSAEGIAFSLSGAIRAWEDGGVLEPDDGPVEAEYEEHDGWFSYAGLRYDTVTLSNGQVWMATPLAYLPAGTAVSDNPSSGSVWYPYSVVDKAVNVLKDDASIAERGYFYSYDAIFGVKVDETNYDKLEGARGICPPGWHVPTRSEWYALCGYSTSSKYLGESGAQTDPSALYWDEAAGYAPVGAFEAAGFRSLLTGCIANNAYNALTVDSSVSSVEEYFGMNRMAYIASSTPNSPTQMFAAMTTFTSSLPLGRISLGYATLGKTGLQVRCIKD